MLRRDFIKVIAGSAAGWPLVARGQPVVHASPNANDAGAALNRLLDEFMQITLNRSPESVTSLGLDKGKLASAKSRLDDRSRAAIQQDQQNIEDWRRRLKTIDRAALSGQSAVNYDIVAYWLDTQSETNRKFGEAAGRPYVLTHEDGAYRDIPDFLDNNHTVANKADADAYLARLHAYARALDQVTELVRYDAGRGIVLPDFILDKVISELKTRANTKAEESGLITSLTKRAQAQKIAGDYGGPATRIYQFQIVPALNRQLAVLTNVRAKATHDAGMWKLKDGEALYAALLKQQTTTAMSADNIHKLGLELTAEINNLLDQSLRAEGLTQRSVGARMRTMFDDAKYRYANNETGREELLADLRQKVEKMQAQLPGLFKTLPKAGITVKRVPLASENGASAAYYHAPAVDGSRPGIFYINLRDISIWPKWRPASIVYHEAIPGHHLQKSLALEKGDLPLFIKVRRFTAFNEGWALYAEQLADEIGIYADDPLSRIGYLHAAIWRAGRLVVDTGTHAMRWSRERAIQYLMDLMGTLESDATSEIDRYCADPGQACSYMVGKFTLLNLRDRAKNAFGPRFDLRSFHDAILFSGSVPLAVLGRLVDDYIQQNKI